jgi:hypothetical protein
MSGDLRLASTVCIVELLRNGARFMIKLVDLLEDSNVGAASLSLSILLQISTTDAGRSALISSRIQKYLLPLLVSETNVSTVSHRGPSNNSCAKHQDGRIPLGGATTDSIYSRVSHQRVILMLCALIRQQEWRPYDPDNLPSELINTCMAAQTVHNRSDHAGVGQKTLRDLILTDVLRTLKTPTLDRADSLTITDLVLLHFNEEVAVAMSKDAEDVGTLEICAYISRPGDIQYFPSLEWAESSACCQVSHLSVLSVLE